jgi:hypothetical protein
MRRTPALLALLVLALFALDAGRLGADPSPRDPRPYRT